MQAEEIKERLQVLIHNLKNELAVLKQCLTALEKEIAKGPEKADFNNIQKYAQLMRVVSERQDEYAERLTDANKADPKTGLRDVDLENLITEVAELMLVDIPWRIQKNKDYDKLIIHGSQFDLKSMFVNLFKNAKEAIEKVPEGTIIPEKHEVVILLENTKNSEFCRVVIMDTGPGFVDPKGAFDKGMTSKKGDHGVGLQSVRKVVEMHHGTVMARNRRDGRRGAAIIIRLNLK